jgi:hypothetical protein
MLIRNATSFQDLQQKKQLQAELLQVQIDNEALLEKRVSDYQNPNKPPPLPPQYKTASELAEDSLYQQRLVIDNLRSLNIDYRVAAAVSQELLQLPDGQGNLVKFNKNFPLIKSDIQKRFDVKLLDNQVIIEYLKEFFDEIDTAIGLNLTGTSSTNYFQTTQPLFAKGVLPSSEDYTAIKGLYDTLSANFNLATQDLQTLNSQFVDLILISPTEDELNFIDTLPSIERQRLNKIANSLTKKIPSVSFISKAADTIQDIIQIQDPAQKLQEFQQISTTLLRSFGSVSDKDQELLIKFKEKIAEQQGQIAKTQASISGVVAANPVAGVNRQDVIDANKKYINQRIGSLVVAQAKERITFPALQGDYNNQYLNQVPTTDGRPPAADYSNVIFEKGYIDKVALIKDAQGIVTGIDYAKQRDKLSPELENPVLLNGSFFTPPQGVSIDDYLSSFLLIAVFTSAHQTVTLSRNGKSGKIKKVPTPNGGSQIPLTDLEADFDLTNPDYGRDMKFNRYKLPFLKQVIETKELPTIINKLDNDPTYDPLHLNSQHIIKSQGFGLKKDKGSATPNFNAKRIKVGKGIAVQEELPRYRSFGKYIIHYPHLIEDSVLNLKFPSTGSIPSIKPVKIDDNYKQFIKDVLDTNKVNKRHYESLTEQEKNHFLKIARGAKITSLITFVTEEKEDEDYKRLELCIGEINAGNDNQHIKKEIKDLLKKYVENGKISKLKAADILLQL